MDFWGSPIYGNPAFQDHKISKTSAWEFFTISSGMRHWFDAQFCWMSTTSNSGFQASFWPPKERERDRSQSHPYQKYIWYHIYSYIILYHIIISWRYYAKGSEHANLFIDGPQNTSLGFKLPTCWAQKDGNGSSNSLYETCKVKLKAIRTKLSQSIHNVQCIFIQK